MDTNRCPTSPATPDGGQHREACPRYSCRGSLRLGGLRRDPRPWPPRGTWRRRLRWRLTRAASSPATTISTRTAAFCKARHRLRIVFRIEEPSHNLLLVHGGRPGGALQYHCSSDAHTAMLRRVQRRFPRAHTRSRCVPNLLARTRAPSRHTSAERSLRIIS